MDYVPDKYIIRVEKKLDKKTSYLGYTKKELFVKLQSFIVKGDNEKVLYILIDIIISSFYDELWEILYHISGKYIHIYNPYLTEYLLHKRHLFDGLLLKSINSGKRHELINNQVCRNLLTEIVSIFIYSTKSPIDDSLRIKKTELIGDAFREKITQKNMYIQSILLTEDNLDIIKAANEFAYNLALFDYEKSIYWLEWCILWDKNNKTALCGERDISNISEEYKRDMIWMLWQIIFLISENINDTIVKINRDLFNLFKVKYTKKSTYDKKIILYNCIKIICYNNKYPLELKRRLRHPILATERQPNIVKNIMNINITILEFFSKVTFIHGTSSQQHNDDGDIDSDTIIDEDDYFIDKKNNKSKQPHKKQIHNSVIKKMIHQKSKNYIKKNIDLYDESSRTTRDDNTYYTDNRRDDVYDSNGYFVDIYASNDNMYYNSDNDNNTYYHKNLQLRNQIKETSYDSPRKYDKRPEEPIQQKKSNHSDSDKEEDDTEHDVFGIEKLSSKGDSVKSKSKMDSYKMKMLFSIIRNDNYIDNQSNNEKSHYNLDENYTKKININKNPK